MIDETTATFTLSGLACRQSPSDATTWTYRSLVPQPETTAAGVPTALLVIAPEGGGGHLRMGVRLDPPGEAIEQARATAADVGGADPMLVRMVSDVRSVERVSLAITGMAGQTEEICSADSSGFPPWTALLSADLDRDRAAVVASALRGGRNRLVVVFDLTLAGGSTEQVGADVGSWFASSTGNHVLTVSDPHPSTTSQE